MASTKQQRLALDLGSDSSPPAVAWPTLLLFSVAFVGWIGAMYAGFVGSIPTVLAVALAAVFIFMLFTAMHDAAHGSVCAVRIVNGSVGRLCAVAFMAPFAAFKYEHLMHHKYTNDPERDPDFWSGTWGCMALAPLRWMSQEWHYYIPYAQAVRRGERPRAEVVEVVLTVIGFVAVPVTAYARGMLAAWAVYWLLPLKMSVVCLAYSFDYVPHRPHAVDARLQPYLATNMISGLFRHWDVDLSWPLLNQNFHCIHHLYPWIPFYRYSSVWHQHQDALLALGTPVVTMYDPSTPWIIRPNGNDGSGSAVAAHGEDKDGAPVPSQSNGNNCDNDIRFRPALVATAPDSCSHSDVEQTGELPSPLSTSQSELRERTTTTKRS